MKPRKVICLLLSVILLIGLMPAYVFASETEVDSADKFLSAIESGEKSIKITGSFTLARQKSGISETLTQGNDFIPVIIPDGTRIYAAEPNMYVIGLRFSMQLAGNVAIENVGLNFNNAELPNRIIFMGGHELTLNNINTDGVQDVNIYAGSFDFESNTPAQGNAAHLHINSPNIGSAASPNPKIQNVYLSSAEPDWPSTFKAYNGTAAMTVSQKTKISQVYAKGAEITVNGSGFQASTASYVTDSNTVLTLESGVSQHLSNGAFKEIVLPTGSYLELTEMENGSLVSIEKLTGGGTIIRDGSGVVGIQSYSGNTTVRSSTLSDGTEFFQTNQTPDDTDKFTLDSTNQNAGYELKYENGTLSLAEKSTSSESIVLKNIPYIDENGTEKICPSATAVTDSDTFIYLGSDDGNEYWYAVTEDVTINGMIGIGSNVHLILADGCKLTTEIGTIIDYESSLTVYGQSDSTGEFHSSESDGYCGGIASWDICDITINGGIIHAIGSFGTPGIGGPNCNVTVNGGTVYASSGNTDGEYSGAGIGGCFDESTGTFTINGGFVSAKSCRGDEYHIQDPTYKTATTSNGIVFEDISGIMYGDVTLKTNAEIKSGQTLTIEAGQTLTIAEGVTLTVNGKIINNGTIINNGIIIPDLFNITIDDPGKVFTGKPVKMTVTVTPESESDIPLVWSSSDTKIATVDEKGVLTPHATGTTVITVKTSDGNCFAQRTIRVLTSNPLITIRNLNGSNEQKVDWWKNYSSQTMKLSIKKYNCENAAYYKWTSSNKKVSVDKNNTVINTGYFSRSAVLTLTAYDNDGNIVAKSSIKVSFYKFDWQKDKLKTQSTVSDNYLNRNMPEQQLNPKDENEFISAFRYFREYINMVFKSFIANCNIYLFL